MDMEEFDCPQPAPQSAKRFKICRQMPQGTEARVCEDIQRRQSIGIQKYGVTVEQNSLSSREWLQHAYEEALDLAIYLKRAIEEIEKNMLE